MKGPPPRPAAVAGAPDAAGFVLAGGKSSRMGSDKALVQLDGQALIVHALEILRQAGLNASVAGGCPQLAAFAPLIPDSQPGLGPLSGICAALSVTSPRWAVFLPVDLPLLPPSLLSYLLNHARLTGNAVTVPSMNGFAQTFPAVVDREILPMLKRELESRRGGCFSGFKAAAASLGQSVTVVQVEMLIQAGQIPIASGPPAARWFSNVNTAEDLRRAGVHCRAMIA